VELYRVPTFAFQVSGEYAMIKAAGALEGGEAFQDGAVLVQPAVGAGAAGVITYFAPQAARVLGA
jgi:porphobilinogen synthase